MRLLYITFLCLFTLQTTIAQIKISGNIVDTETQKPIEYANILIFTASDSVMIAGVVSDEKGAFIVNNVPTNQSIFARFQFLGYESKKVPIVFSKSTNTINLGTISLKINRLSISEVTITGERSTTVTEIDKQIFTASKFQNAANGTAADVLRNIPSITINNEGEVAMRGSTGLIVLINGKPTALSAEAILKQIAANNIEKIEVITAPTAKYDPDGKTGIINIITKTTSRQSKNLSINGMFGGTLPMRFGGDLMVNVNKNKVEYYFGADYKRMDLLGDRIGEIRTLINNKLVYSPSVGIRNYVDYTYNIQGGLSYTPNSKSLLNVGFYVGKKQTDRTADLHYKEYEAITNKLYLNNFDKPRLEFFNKNLFIRYGTFQTLSADFSRQFTKGKLSFSALYEHSELGGPLTNLNLEENTQVALVQENSSEKNPLNALRVGLDYALNLKNNHKFETGIQFRSLNHKGIFDYQIYNEAQKKWVADPAFNNSLDLTQYIYSGYGLWSGQKNKLTYNAGLRVEYFDRHLTHNQSVNPYDFKQFNLFPSAQLLWKTNPNNSLKLAIARRIDRPSTKLMAPFKNHRHAEVYEEGDPSLRPEIANIVELGYIHNFGKSTITATVYQNYIQDKIFRINGIVNEVALYRNFTNAGNATSKGLEITADLKPLPWWNLFAGGTIYHYSLNGTFLTREISASSTNYNYNFNTSFQLSKTTRFQWDFNYISSTVTSQGQDLGYYLSNVSLRQSIFKNKGYLMLQGKDIFNSNITVITTQDSDFYSTTRYHVYGQIYTLGFGLNLNEFKRKSKDVKSEFGTKEF